MSYKFNRVFTVLKFLGLDLLSVCNLNKFYSTYTRFDNKGEDRIKKEP